MSQILTSAVRRGGAAVAVGLTALTFSACGGSDGEAGAAASGADASAPSDNDRDTARVRLQQCLRDQGIELPEPGQGGGPGGGGGVDESDREKRREALEGPCKEFRQGAFGDISEEDRQELQDAFQEFASCMRDNGVDIPDMQPGQGGGPGGGGRGLDRDDPDVQAAREQCQDKLPQRRRGGGAQ